MKKRRDEERTQSVALGTVIIVIVLVLAFGAAFRYMYSLDILFLGDFMEGIFGLDDKNDGSSFDIDALSEIVKVGKDGEKEGIVLDISYENMRDALLTEKASEGVYLKAKINYYADSKASSHYITYHRFDGKFRVEVFEKANETAPKTLKVSDSVTILFKDFTTKETVTYKNADDILPENEAGIPTVDGLLHALEDFPVIYNTADSSIKDCIIKMINTEMGNVYYVAFTNTETGLCEEYYVVPEYLTIISSVTSTLDGDIIYSYEVTHFSTDREDYSDQSLYKIS